jgi:hypothetical protein
MKKYFIIFSTTIVSVLLSFSCLEGSCLIARGGFGGAGGFGGGRPMQRTPSMSRVQYPGAVGAGVANRRNYNNNNYNYPQGGYYPVYTEPQPQYPQQYTPQYPQYNTDGSTQYYQN